MNGLHVFIDNSNLYIASRSVATGEPHFYDFEMCKRLRIDFGNLLEKIKDGRKLMEAVLVGSRPPQNDSLWNKLETLKIKPKIFDRSFYTGGEKRVDAELTNTIRDTLDDNVEPGTIALVAGDQDYIPTLERVFKRGWNVEVYFWEHSISPSLRYMDSVKFISLNDYFDDITFIEKQKE